LAEKKGIDLKRVQLSDLQAVEPRITDDVYNVLDPARSAKSRTSFGGTAPSNVRREAERWIKRLEKDAVSR
jgi:argininosuccinate lyase